ncbi:MAG: FAD-dependent oxidoreductase [Deltaproteobacteria bacterium]|nr:FAD-dependent oxidoreductase [Deltaproteobacteria bacterium]
MTLTGSDFQTEFKSEITAMPGGELVKLCFDCGTCTGACPVSESGTGFDPRKMLHMIKMGLKDRLLSSPTLWHCTHCDTCLFVCPQNVRFSSVVDVLREMAVNQGYDGGEAVEKWGTAPCKATCPAHISIPGFVGAIADGRYEEGLKLIKEELPFPGICGRICPHPCEEQCNRGRTDKPVAIEYLKRFLADADNAKEPAYIPEKKPDKKERVAVLGAGPAGLTAAYYLAIEGYPLTVFEKLPVAGGMMAAGIPEFRLPRDILQAEIDVIRKLGAEIRLNVEIGKDIGLADLQKEYDAIFIGAGCQRSIKLHIPGEDDLTGVWDGLTFLREINLGHPPAPGGKLVIIGGGNTAVDCARTALRLGYEEVAILYRRTREEMPASPWEVEDTIEEDIDVQYLTAPVKILGENGKVTGLECIRMELGEPDASGRRRPLPVEGSEFVVSTDVVVTALGQVADLSCLPEDSGVNVSNRGLIMADPRTGVTDSPGIFSGGDVVSGPRTVVEAVAAGKEAAISIDRYLRGEGPDARRGRDWKGIEYVPEGVEKQERQVMQRLSLFERKRTFEEIDLGFSEEEARCEARRCFRICGMQRTETTQTKK